MSEMESLVGFRKEEGPRVPPSRVGTFPKSPTLGVTLSSPFPETSVSIEVFGQVNSGNVRVSRSWGSVSV